jgi:hypothetical protein
MPYHGVLCRYFNLSSGIQKFTVAIHKVHNASSLYAKQSWICTGTQNSHSIRFGRPKCGPFPSYDMDISAGGSGRILHKRKALYFMVVCVHRWEFSVDFHFWVFKINREPYNMSPSALICIISQCCHALCIRSVTFLIFLIFGGCPLSSTKICV